jgi:hypothetical protein
MIDAGTGFTSAADLRKVVKFRADCRSALTKIARRRKELSRSKKDPALLIFDGLRMVANAINRLGDINGSVVSFSLDPRVFRRLIECTGPSGPH